MKIKIGQMVRNCKTFVRFESLFPFYALVDDQQGKCMTSRGSGDHCTKSSQLLDIVDYLMDGIWELWMISCLHR